MWNLENAKTLIFTPSQIPYKLVAGRRKKWFKKKEEEGEEEGKEEKEKEESCFGKDIKVGSCYHLD